MDHRVIAFAGRQQVFPGYEPAGFGRHRNIQRAEMSFAPLSRSVQINQEGPPSIPARASLPLAAIDVIVEMASLFVARSLPGFQPPWIALEKNGKLLFHSLDDAQQFRAEPSLLSRYARAEMFADFRVKASRSSLNHRTGVPVRTIQVPQNLIAEVQTDEGVNHQNLSWRQGVGPEFANHL